LVGYINVTGKSANIQLIESGKGIGLKVKAYKYEEPVG
jgi:hypothetical protein